MQAQMTPATAPGIAGLMQGKPVSPTAAIGNVPQRISAYGEQGLAQKNAMSQDLLDLIAAQKLKAEKQAAINQMQLDAAQQGQPLTVAESLDKELLDMTKQELSPQQAAPMVAQTASVEDGRQRQAIQRLAQGITRAPGADQVMPARMASGGIVAFQNRGEVPEPRPEKMEGETREEFRARLMAWWNRKMQAEEAARAAIPPSPRTAARFPSIIQQRQPRAPEPGMSEADLQDLMPTRQPLPQTPLPPEMGAEQPARVPPQAPAMRIPPNQVQSKVPAVDRGVATALPGPVVQSPGGIMGPQRPTLEQATEQTAMGMMGRGPEDMARSREERLRELTDPAYKAQREAQQAYIKQLEEQYGKAQPSGLQALAAGLRGFAQSPGGIGYGLMGAGQAASGYTAQQDARRLQQMQQLQGLREKMLGADVSRAEGMFKAGQDVLPSAMQSQAAGVRAGTDILGTRERAETAKKQIASQEQVAAMDREVRLKVANIQASAARGDDKGKLAVERLKAVMDDPQLKELAKQAAVNPTARAQYNQRLDELIRQLAPEFANKPTAPAAGTATNDPLGIRK